MSALVEELCEVMHDAYEAAAVEAGWETQERSRKPWADVPEANKETMRAAVQALLERLVTLMDAAGGSYPMQRAFEQIKVHGPGNVEVVGGDG